MCVYKKTMPGEGVDIACRGDYSEIIIYDSFYSNSLFTLGAAMNEREFVDICQALIVSSSFL